MAKSWTPRKWGSEREKESKKESSESFHRNFAHNSGAPVSYLAIKSFTSHRIDTKEITGATEKLRNSIERSQHQRVNVIDLLSMQICVSRLAPVWLNNNIILISWSTDVGFVTKINQPSQATISTELNKEEKVVDVLGLYLKMQLLSYPRHF